MSTEGPSVSTALIAGAIAGSVVDVTLFPLDTVKTRLQSSNGFWKSGGFKRIYAGLAPQMVGSAPSAAMFFCVYEVNKRVFGNCNSNYLPVVHMFAASTGEMAACLIRVPTEVVKQRSQATRESGKNIIEKTFRQEGIRGFYRGYFSTVIREVPFSLIQFPLWELFKRTLDSYQGYPSKPWQSMFCGALAGGIAGSLTTPLDVAKTRIILSKKDSKEASGNIIYVITQIFKHEGVKGLFAGVLPRIFYISIGGAVFLGGYSKAVSIIS